MKIERFFVILAEKILMDFFYHFWSYKNEYNFYRRWQPHNLFMIATVKGGNHFLQTALKPLTLILNS